MRNNFWARTGYRERNRLFVTPETMLFLVETDRRGRTWHAVPGTENSQGEAPQGHCAPSASTWPLVTPPLMSLIRLPSLLIHHRTSRRRLLLFLTEASVTPVTAHEARALAAAAGLLPEHYAAYAALKRLGYIVCRCAARKRALGDAGV